jgi:regulatory protein
MAGRKPRKPRPPLEPASLDELALAYVGRFATSRSKLAAYLNRKLRERGWDGERPPDVEALVERLSSAGYVDDAAYALSKSRSLTARGYGLRRVSQTLRAAGVDEEDSGEARELAEADAVEAALRFARRRRIGPFGQASDDRSQREKALAAMVRAGHSFALASAILRLGPGSDIDPEALARP